MFLTCPRCDCSSIDSSGSCSSCGYTLRVTCRNCNFKNIPLAKFCGKCGSGLSLKTQLSTFINRNFDYLVKIRVKKFAAGIAFGSLLGFFAFGSMGMHVSDKQNLNDSAFHRNHADMSLYSSLYEELNNFRNLRGSETIADFNDLKRFTEILLNNLSETSSAKLARQFETPDADYYLSKVRNFSINGKLCKGSASIVLFNLASDILDLSYKEFSDETHFHDIPRFHFLSVPANALSNLGILQGKTENEFGTKDPLTVEQLFQAGLGFTDAAAIRNKQKVFFTMQPR
ncbi:MAG: Double zinc ribbon [Clostridiales bacterium]|jgi:hypothetical protein|nr:Double zinc ribbon [Clostridiales bacterium]MDN5282321.1 Double zinc ribbon [Candidatus Ozemobacter sp.]